MLFYLKRDPSPGITPVQIIPENVKFCTRTQVVVATQYYEKNSGLSALFQYAPIYAHVNAGDHVILFKKRPKPGNNSGANYPRERQILHKNSGLVATQDYEKNSGLSALFQYAPIYAHVNADHVILFKKRPKPGNNSGANYPRERQILHKNSGCGGYTIL